MTVIGIAMMAIMVGAIVWAAVAALRGGGRSRPRSGPDEILDERFARGEIDADEYDRRRRTLGHADR